MYKRILIIMILALALTGCSKVSGPETRFILSSTDYTSDLELNSPEGLAKASNLIYQQMLNEEINIEDGFNQLLELSSKDSADVLSSYEKDFVNEISATVSYLKANGDGINEFVYAKTEYVDEGRASIKRIQKQKSGKEYYFQQDYVKEAGVWKIKGDNVINDFEIIKKFMFWNIEQ